MLTRTLRAALVLLLAATCALTGTTAASAARPEAVAAPASARSSVAAEADTLDLRGDGVLPRGDGRVARVQLWKVHTLYYYETLPAKWDWSLSTAVAKWNGSGARIRMVRTTVPRKAQLRIGYAKIGSAGLATVGATRNAFVHLSSRFSSMDAVDARNRVTIMNVLAHELGHVLGFQHTTARCSLMAPVIDVDACGTVPSSQPGYYKCRTIDTALVKRFVKVYGGSARYPAAAWCLIDPLPPVLGGVSFSGGLAKGAPVGISWQRPGPAPSGSKIVIRTWLAGSCSTVPAGADTITPPWSSTSWQDTHDSSEEAACFRIQLVNRSGAGRPAVTKALTRFALPPSAPVIGTATYDDAVHAFHAPATYPPGTHLMYAVDNDHPEVCPDAVAPRTWVTQDVGRLGAGVVEFVSHRAPACVSFFAVHNKSGKVSAPTSITVDAPVPTETLAFSELTQYQYPYWEATATGAAIGHRVAWTTVHGPCSEANLADAKWGVGDPAYYPDPVFFSRGAGTNCAIVTSVDWLAWNPEARGEGLISRHGPLAMREFTDDGPAAPILGEPAWDAGAGRFLVPADRDTQVEAIYDPSDPSTCPAPGAAGATSIYLLNRWNPDDSVTLSLAPPTPDTCVTFYRDAGEGYIPMSDGVEVRLVVPQG